MSDTNERLFCTEKRSSKQRKRAKSSERDSISSPEAKFHAKLTTENRLLKSHLNAAYAEIGKLKVRLIEVALDLKYKDDLTNFQSAESKNFHSPLLLEDNTGLQQSSVLLKQYVHTDEEEEEECELLELERQCVIRNLDQEW